MKIYACFFREGDKAFQHETAHRLLQFALRCEYGIEEYVLTENSHGKPFLESHPEVKFNLSHCKGLAVCALSDSTVGADCEPVRKLRPGVVRRVCAQAETEELLIAVDKDLHFTRLWTLKECFVKAVGRGVSYPMKNAAFSLDGGISTNVTGCTFYQYVIGDSWVISACTGENNSQCELFITGTESI